MDLSRYELQQIRNAPAWLESWLEARREDFNHLGTMHRTSRMFKRNGGPKEPLYRTLWDVPRMNGDETMLGMKR